jgi:hypothetical protein
LRCPTSKGRERATRGKWDFRFVRGNPRTSTGTYAYAAIDFDVTAVVALSLERALFFPGVHRSLRLTTADFLRPDGEGQSWARALAVFNRKHQEGVPRNGTRSPPLSTLVLLSHKAASCGRGSEA